MAGPGVNNVLVSELNILINVLKLIFNYIYRVSLCASKARATAPGVESSLHLPARIIQDCPSGAGSASDPARCGHAFRGLAVDEGIIRRSQKGGGCPYLGPCLLQSLRRASPLALKT